MHLSTVLSSGLGISTSQVSLGSEQNVLRETSFSIPPKKTESPLTYPTSRNCHSNGGISVWRGDWHLNHSGKKERFQRGVDHSRHLSWSWATLCFLPSVRVWCEETWIVDIISTLCGTVHWGSNDAVVIHFQNIVYPVSAKSESVVSYYTQHSVECHAWQMLALYLRVSLLSSLGGLILATLPILIVRVC